MKTNKKIIIGLALISLMLCTFVVVQPAQALIPLVIGAFVLGTLIGGIIGGYMAAQANRQALINSVNWQYAEDTAINYENLISSSTQEFTNEKNLIANMGGFFSRKAEYAAQYFVNESTFPYDKVLTLAGLEGEYNNLTDTAREQLRQIAYIAQGFANTTFTDDMNDYTVKALYSFGSSSNNEAASLYTNLKTTPITVGDGCLVSWKDTNPSTLTWTLNGGVTVDSGDYLTSTLTTGNLTVITSSLFEITNGTDITVTAQIGEGSSSDVVIYLDVLNAADQIIDYATPITLSGSSNTMFSGVRTFTINDINADQIKLRFKHNTAGASDSTTWGNIGIVTETPTATDTTFTPVLLNGNNIVGTFAFTNSTATQRKINLNELINAASDYSTAFRTQIRNAMTAAQAYWTYIRGLGYTDYSQIPTLIPPLDVIMPPTNSTFWTDANISTEEYYAMFAAYMKSLNDLFSNTTIARTIDTVDTRNITMTNMPVYATGRIFDNSSATWTDFCSSIWVQPTVGNITLTKGVNNTLGTTAQIIYKVNSTGTIVYLQAAANDIIEVTDIQLKGTNGAWTTQSAVTLSTSTLETYATTYITGYEGIDYPETPIPWGTAAMTTLIITIAMFSMIGGIFNKKKH